MYRAWCDALAPEIEVMPVQLPGRENRISEPAQPNLQPTIAALMPVIESMADKPFGFFGHSFGALLAFELSRNLRAKGKPYPSRLFLSSSRAIHLTAVHPLMGPMTDDELLNAIISRYGADVRVKDSELYRLMLPTIRADIIAMENCPADRQVALDIPITAFGGENDRFVPLQEIEPWAEHTTSTFELVRFPGAHFYLNDSADTLLNQIRTRLLP